MLSSNYLVHDICDCDIKTEVTPSPSALSEPQHLQQHRLREMGAIIQQESHNAAARLTLQ